jgi:transposase
MKEMIEYEMARQMHQHRGKSQRAISRELGCHRETVKKMLENPEPPGYRMKKPRPKRKLEGFIPIIDQILEDDKRAPVKQRHASQRIFERLKNEHGFKGGYTIVREYVRDKKISLKEVYFPLIQEMGTSQVDFGEAEVIIGGVRQTAHVFCMALPYSDAVFVCAYPTEGFEAVADGHNRAYKFLDGVPPHSLYDNMSTAINSQCRDEQREVTDNFRRLRSHYVFQSRFCNVGRPNEKGVVENLVGYVRRNFLVPVPSFAGWEELNAYLLECCRKRLLQTAAGKDKTIGELLEEERKTFLPLPAAEFDACQSEARRVTSLSLTQYKTNSYSVPVEYAYRSVTVKAYVFQIEICHKDQVIAKHKRSYGRDDFIFDPRHYLPLLKTKPGGLDSARPFNGWELPKCFDTLRRYLESKQGNEGKREYIRVLQLLREYPPDEVRRAIERAFHYRSINSESIQLTILTGREDAFEIVPLSEAKLAGLPKVRVEQNDIACYNGLMPGGAL